MHVDQDLLQNGRALAMKWFLIMLQIQNMIFRIVECDITVMNSLLWVMNGNKWLYIVGLFMILIGSNLNIVRQANKICSPAVSELAII